MRALPPQPTPNPTVLFQDEHIVVADKPTMMLSVPGRGPEKADCLSARLMGMLGQELHVIHRLDMETSGLIVLAKTKEAQSAISKQFQDRTPAKTYTADVFGLIADAEFSIDLPLITDWPNRPKQKVDHDTGKPSFTHGKVLSRHAKHTRITLHPITGRSHQLRVHMAEHGFPILGDSLYAFDEAFNMRHRMALHASKLSFNHPTSGERLTFESDVPF